MHLESWENYILCCTLEMEIAKKYFIKLGALPTINKAKDWLRNKTTLLTPGYERLVLVVEPNCYGIVRFLGLLELPIEEKCLQL